MTDPATAQQLAQAEQLLASGQHHYCILFYGAAIFM